MIKFIYNYIYDPKISTSLLIFNLIFIVFLIIFGL